MAADIQLQMRRNVEKMHETIGELDSWLGDIGKRDAQLRGVAAPTGSGKRGGVADDDTDEEEEARAIEEAKEELRKLALQQNAEAAAIGKPDAMAKCGGSGGSGGKKGPLTHAQKYGQWERFDADAIVEQIDKTEAEREQLRKEVVRLENRRLQSQERKKAAAAAAASEALRLQGNEAFSAARYEEAVGLYTDALGHTPRSAVLYANRALALLKLHAHAEAEEDCDAALLIEPANVKALLRRAQARHATEQYDHALADLESALEHEPRNAAARSLMAECRRLKSLQVPRPKPTLTKLSIEQVEHDADNDGDAFVLALAPPPPPEDATHRITAAPSRAIAGAAAAALSEHPASSSASTEAVAASTAEPVATATGGASTMRPPRVLSSAVPTADSFPLPTTLAEVERAWRSLRSDRAEFAAYVRRVEPSRFESLFRNNLPAELFSALLAALDGHFAPEEAPRILAIMRALTTAGRFSILTMCLDKPDQKAIDSLNIKLIEAQGRGDLPADEDLETMRKAYS